MNGAVVILGATSAIARAVALEFAQRGKDVIVASRDEEENALIAHDIHIRHGVAVTGIEFNAEAFDTHQEFFDTCVESHEHGIEGVVLCFGFLDEQVVVQHDLELTKRTIDVNLTGAASVLNLFADYLEKRGSGFIAGVSSVAGDRGRQSNYIYGASKAGFSAYLQGLRNRLYHAGVQVTTIKPGFIDTKMTYGLPNLFLVATPERAARDIYNAIARRKNVAYVPWFWRYIMWIIRSIPEWQFKKMRL